MANSIESVMVETRVFPPPQSFVQQANVSGQAAYQALLDEADRDPNAFWGRMAREQLQWTKPFTKVLDESRAPFFEWFGDGDINVSAKFLDDNLKNGNANKIAIIFEADGGEVLKITYQQLYERVCKFANGLKSLGYKAGDRSIIYLPMSIEAVVAMQACARLGITHSVVFGGFSAKSLHERIVDVGASLVITADEQLRGGRAIPLKPAVDDRRLHAADDLDFVLGARHACNRQPRPRLCRFLAPALWECAAQAVGCRRVRVRRDAAYVGQ
jgi:acetyl-CoA synthetase